MKVLFATSNPAKVRNYKEKLLKSGIELLTLKDIDIHIHVEENGKNAIENAYIKAKVLMSIPKCTKKGIYLCTKRGMKLYT